MSGTSYITSSLCCLLMVYALASYRNLGNYLWLSALTGLNLFVGSPVLLALSLTAYLLAHQVNLTTSVVVVAMSKLFLASVLATSVGGVTVLILLVGAGSFILTLDAALTYLALGGLYILYCCCTFFFFIFFIFYLYTANLSSLCAFALIMGLPLSGLFLLKFNIVSTYLGLVVFFLLLPMSTWGSKFLLMEVSFRGGRGVVTLLGGLLLGS